MNKYKLKRGLITKRIKNNMTIFSSEESLLISLDGIGTFIFLRLKKNLSLEEITDLIVEEYSVSKRTAREDALSFIKELMKASILE